MLSFIYRLARDFEKEHGIHPNLLYLNPTHLQFLREQLDNEEQLDNIVKLLGMEIMITKEVIHPHVVWTHLPSQRQAM
ncbi:MAG: hypothetical protein OEZ16_01470 [Chromatiales bacterium]|nr:hypothetical protein [Chromatiales bacterium]